MGGDLLVRGSVALARRLRVSPAVVAATVVGFGTSLPEMVVSVRAAVTGYPGLILGNVVGSNIANVLLVSGVAAVIYPLIWEDSAVRRNLAIMVGSTLGFAGLCAVGDIGRVEGLLLLAQARGMGRIKTGRCGITRAEGVGVVVVVKATAAVGPALAAQERVGAAAAGNDIVSFAADDPVA
ncbi:MAG: sodium:calcium antiporter [Gemmatimonadetes bacterium]|nr:sodium:calcium antiporter [Gemmatimonadota bacterium]